jgi:hypothetical protein
MTRPMWMVSEWAQWWLLCHVDLNSLKGPRIKYCIIFQTYDMAAGNIQWDGRTDVLDNICASQVLLQESAMVECWVSDCRCLERTRTRSQEKLALSCAMFLEAETPLVHGTSDIAKFPWSCRETNPPSRMKIAKIYATGARPAGTEKVNCDI